MAPLLHLILAIPLTINYSSPVDLSQPSSTYIETNFPLYSAPISQSDVIEPIKEKTVIIQKIEVLGSTVFSDEELAEVVAPFLGKDAFVEQLLEIRTKITRLYISKGYTTSAAFVPPQDLSEGVVQIQVVEGELEAIEIEGLNRVREGYVKERLLLAAEPPLNVLRLRDALGRLQSNPLFKRVEAELKWGTAPNRSILMLKLSEAPAFSIVLQGDNYESPNIGEDKGSIGLEHLNLLGRGEHFRGFYGITEGLNKYGVSYAFGLNDRDGTLKVELTNDDSEVIDPRFARLDLRAESQTLSFSFRQPVIQTPETEVGLALTLDLRKTQTFIFGTVPFSFTTGPDRGNSRVTVLRFSQDWLNRTTERVLAARSQFSFGLDLFNPTINDLGIDGRFVSWQGQFQWVEQLSRDFTLVNQLNAQLTGDTLLPLEQFFIGGVTTVRGYPRNSRTGDSGITGSLEARINLFNDPDRLGTLQVVPFFDVGHVGNNGREVLSSNTLASTGLGLRWQFQDSILTRIDYGIPLIRLDSTGNSLQENGLFFSIQWRTKF